MGEDGVVEAAQVEGKGVAVLEEADDEQMLVAGEIRLRGTAATPADYPEGTGPSRSSAGADGRIVRDGAARACGARRISGFGVFAHASTISCDIVTLLLQSLTSRQRYGILNSD